jgi:hypothetical protein
LHASSGAGSISPNELVSKLIRPDFLNKLHAVAANARRLADAPPRPQAPQELPQEPPLLALRLLVSGSQPKSLIQTPTKRSTRLASSASTPKHSLATLWTTLLASKA